MANFIYNFKIAERINSVIPDWLLKRSDLKLMLWAGDGCHDGKSDIARLPGYDVYLCAGIPEHLELNKTDLYARPPENPACICIIDVSYPNMMARFTSLFKGRFALIDSDYYGNTPTLLAKYYEELLAMNGKAFHIQGINSLRYPQMELQDIMEIFAPVLPDDIALKRKWTSEMIELAKNNCLDVHQTWGSRDMHTDYYKEMRARQEKYLNDQKERFPLLQTARTVPISQLEKYWAQLPLNTLQVDFQTAWTWEYTDGSCILPYKQRFADFLENTFRGVGYEVVNTNDFKAFIARNSSTVDSKIKALQHVLKCVNSIIFLLVSDSLHFTVGFYTDTRDPLNETKYGVTVQKLYASK
jgi:hypothetical protein